MGALLKDALGVLGGKGGGGPDFAQGSGAPEKVDDALALAAHRLAHP
jgi:alanyl-tRNA synthetase